MAPRHGIGAPAVTISARSVWRIRAGREWPRYLLYLLCAAGLAASARVAIDPPSARQVFVKANADRRDLAGEGFASLFARRYLDWNSAEPQAHSLEVTQLGGPGAEAADIRVPASGEQHVLWTQVVQARVAAPGVRIYTVAAETDTDGVAYLTVPVARSVDGRLSLSGYPAFVGPPAAAPAQLSAAAPEVSNPALSVVIVRALRNYLAGSAQELAADLTSGARVSLPSQQLGLESVERVTWSPDRRSVLAIVHAGDARGVQYTLGYELDVTLTQGRWEVSAVQMDPTA